MAVSMKDVRALLDPDEPRYEELQQLGAGALPHLRKLVAGDDPMLASKAAYAASLVDAGAGADVVRAAAQHDDAVVRVAAAAAATNLPAESASAVLSDLVADDDAGVRKVALSSIPDEAGDELLALRAEAPGLAAAEEALLPGEGLPLVGGLMPGERPGGEADTGLMPGESSADASDGMRDRMPGESA